MEHYVRGYDTKTQWMVYWYTHLYLEILNCLRFIEKGVTLLFIFTFLLFPVRVIALVKLHPTVTFVNGIENNATIIRVLQVTRLYFEKGFDPTVVFWLLVLNVVQTNTSCFRTVFIYFFITEGFLYKMSSVLKH